MGKYSDEQKVAAAADYCQGQQGIREVARRHGVHMDALRQWAAAYRVHGAVGVQTKERKRYSAQFKLSVVRCMRAEKLSGRQVAALFGVRNLAMIGQWQRAYAIGGVAALQPHTGIRHTTMAKHSDVELEAREAEDEARSRQELLEELRQLRMENAYLKKLKALAQEEQQTVRDNELGSCKS
jgi:transposase